jgi:hypothetical protein
MFVWVSIEQIIEVLDRGLTLIYYNDRAEENKQIDDSLCNALNKVSIVLLLYMPTVASQKKEEYETTIFNGNLKQNKIYRINRKRKRVAV